MCVCVVHLIVTRMGFEPMLFSVKGRRLKPLVQRAIIVLQKYVFYFDLPNLFLSFFFNVFTKSDLKLVLTNLTFDDSEVPDKTIFSIIYSFNRLFFELPIGFEPTTLGPK